MFETVFSKDDKVEFILRAKMRGYFVRVFFIATTDPTINAARIAARVMRGGHSVAIEKIISRYHRSLANLPAAVAIADRVYVYDNSIDNAEARLCARTQDGRVRKIYGPLPEWIRDAIAPFDRHTDYIDLRIA